MNLWLIKPPEQKIHYQSSSIPCTSYIEQRKTWNQRAWSDTAHGKRGCHEFGNDAQYRWKIGTTKTWLPVYVASASYRHLTLTLKTCTINNDATYFLNFIFTHELTGVKFLRNFARKCPLVAVYTYLMLPKPSVCKLRAFATWTMHGKNPLCFKPVMPKP